MYIGIHRDKEGIRFQIIWEGQEGQYYGVVGPNA